PTGRRAGLGRPGAGTAGVGTGTFGIPLDRLGTKRRQGQRAAAAPTKAPRLLRPEPVEGRGRHRPRRFGYPRPSTGSGRSGGSVNGRRRRRRKLHGGFALSLSKGVAGTGLDALATHVPRQARDEAEAGAKGGSDPDESAKIASPFAS